MFSERFGTRLRRYLPCANLFILFISYFPRTISTYLRRLSCYTNLTRPGCLGSLPAPSTTPQPSSRQLVRWGNKNSITKSSLIVQGMVTQHQRQCGGDSSPWFMLCLESHSVSCYSTLLVIEDVLIQN